MARAAVGIEIKESAPRSVMIATGRSPLGARHDAPASDGPAALDIATPSPDAPPCPPAPVQPAPAARVIPRAPITSCPSRSTDQVRVPTPPLAQPLPFEGAPPHPILFFPVMTPGAGGYPGLDRTRPGVTPLPSLAAMPPDRSEAATPPTPPLTPTPGLAWFIRRPLNASKPVHQQTKFPRIMVTKFAEFLVKRSYWSQGQVVPGYLDPLRPSSP